jgi:class 3 adenylate cyclase
MTRGSSPAGFSTGWLRDMAGRLSSATAAEACRRALAAARAAQANVEALAEPAGIEDFEGVGFRLALHLGEVLYGNRLDFTCIGHAVNLARAWRSWPVGCGG